MTVRLGLASGGQEPNSHYRSLASNRKRGTEKLGEFAGQDHYFAYRYEDVTRILGDDRLFSSEVIASRYSIVLGKTVLVGMTGREHAAKRRLISGEFSRAAVTQLHKTTIDEVVQKAFAHVDWNTPQDLIQLTAAIPASIISRIMGVDAKRIDDVQKWTTAIFYFAAYPREGVRAARALRRILLELIAERRLRPREDLVSKLIGIQETELNFGDNEILSTVLLLLTAGVETTRCAIGNLLWALLTDSDSLISILSSPSFLDASIEESLRWEAPAQFTARVTQEDLQVADVVIPSNSVLLAHIGSANHDPAVFSNPEEFSLARPNVAQHVAFGLGKHRCPGRHLARAEMAAVVSGLASVLPGLRVRPKDSCPIKGGLFREIEALEVTMNQSRGAKFPPQLK